jgi:hypothetical protein
MEHPKRRIPGGLQMTKDVAERHSLDREERLAKCWAWCDEHPCFRSLLQFFTGLREAGEELRQTCMAAFLGHYRKCNACWDNVLIAAERMPDGYRKDVYEDLYFRSFYEMMKARGGAFEQRDTPEGRYETTKFPPGHQELWTGDECFIPSDPKGKGRLVLDVQSEDLFDNPRAVIQRFDQTLCEKAQHFNYPMGRAIQWWAILANRPARLEVRWEGRTKVIAEEWTLHGRYGRLARRARRSVTGEQRDPMDPLTGPDAIAGEALDLLEVAQKYDGRSWFAGYAKAILVY